MCVCGGGGEAEGRVRYVGGWVLVWREGGVDSPGPPPCLHSS